MTPVMRHRDACVISYSYLRNRDCNKLSAALGNEADTEGA